MRRDREKIGGPLPSPRGLWGTLDEIVTDLVETRRQIAALEARQQGLLSQAVDVVTARERDRLERDLPVSHQLPLREISAELGAAMRLSDRSVQGRMGTAAILVAQFPATHQALADGSIDWGHARTIVDEGEFISDPDKRAQYEQRALAAAASETPFRLTQIAKILAARIDPDGAAERVEEAKQDRSVRYLDLGEGRGRVIFEGPAVLAKAIHDRLTSQAFLVKKSARAKAKDEAKDEAKAAKADSADKGGAATTGADNSRPTGDDPPGTSGATAGTAGGNGDKDAAAGVTGATGPAGSARSAAGDAASADERPTDVPDAHADADANADADERFTIVTGPSGEHHDGDDCVGDPRSMDQIRADLFADMILTGAPTGHGDGLENITAQVQITIPALTLLGHSKQPAILAGHGPIGLDTAKRLAVNAPGWDRVLTHPSTGEPVAVDRYRPTAELRRFLAVRDEHCRFPGCTRPPWHCDDDHTIDAALGGPTSDDNLGNGCRPHHIVKHHTLWTVEQIGHGKLLWTSPTGRQYIDTPIGTVTFVPEPIPGVTIGAEEPPPF